MPDKRIEFKINKQKVIEALVYLATKRPRIDVFHICKIFFYADLDHLRTYSRPVLGDHYVAMDDGPVPSFVLNVTKRRIPYAGADWVEEFDKRLAVDESDRYVRLIACSDPRMSVFSRTDLECLDRSIEQHADMSYRALWNKVHDEPSYNAVYREGTSTVMTIESLLPPETPNREKIIEYLQETAQVTAI